MAALKRALVAKRGTGGRQKKKVSEEKYVESMREERIFPGWFLPLVSKPAKWRIRLRRAGEWGERKRVVEGRGARSGARGAGVGQDEASPQFSRTGAATKA